MPYISRKFINRNIVKVSSASTMGGLDVDTAFTKLNASETINTRSDVFATPVISSATPLILPKGYSGNFEDEVLNNSGILRVQAESYSSAIDSAESGSYPNIRIEAEDYISAVDSTPGDNQGGAYRSDFGVDIWPSADTDGTFTIGAVTPGEYLNYTATFPFTGTYQLVARVASDAAGPHVLGVSVDGVQVATFTFNSTGGWFTWTTTAEEEVTVTAGTRDIRIDIIDTPPLQGYNVNWIEFRPDTPAEEPEADKRPSLDVTGNLCVYSIVTDEELTYKVPIHYKAEYLLIARVATNQGSNQVFSIEVDGTEEATLTFTNTGGEYSWTFVSASNSIILEEGLREIKLICTSGTGSSINYFDLVPVNSGLINHKPLFVEGMVKLNRATNKPEVSIGGSWINFAYQDDIDALDSTVDTLQSNADSLAENVDTLKDYYVDVFNGVDTNINADKLSGFDANQLLQNTGSQTVSGEIRFSSAANPVIQSTISFPSGTTAQVAPGLTRQGTIRLFTDTGTLPEQIRTITKVRPSYWAGFITAEENSDCFENLLMFPGLGLASRPSLSGTTFNTTAFNYISDRWLYNIGLGCSCTYTSIPVNASQFPSVLFNSTVNRFAINNTSGYFSILQHTGIPAFSCLGKNFSYSFPARLISGSGAIRINLGIHKGVNNVAPVTEYIFSSNTIHVLDGTFRRYSGTVTIPYNYLSGTSWTSENGLIFVVTMFNAGEGGGIGSQKTVDLGPFFLNYGTTSPQFPTPDIYETQRQYLGRAHYATTRETYRARGYSHSYAGYANGKIHLGTSMRNSFYYSQNVIFTEGFNTSSQTFYPTVDGGEFLVEANGTFRVFGAAVGFGSWFNRELTTLL